MKNGTKLAFLLVLAALLAIGCVNQTSQGGQDTITVAYLPATQSVPLFLALDEGLFEKEGLTVNVQRIETPKDIIDGLITGKIDAGAPSVAAGITTIVESQNPGALKVYALACSYQNRRESDVLLVPVDSNLTAISELKGKKVGHIPGPQWATMTKKTLLVNGVDPSQVTLIELPASSQLPTLAAHGVDAMFVLEPIGLIGEQKQSAKMFMVAPFERFVVDPWCGGAGVVSTKFVQSRPNIAAKFLKVMRQAMQKTNERTDTGKYMMKYLQLPQEASDAVDLPDFIDANELTPETVTAYQKFADVFFELGVTKQKIDVRNLFWDGS